MKNNQETDCSLNPGRVAEKWLQFDKDESAMFCSTCVEAAEIDPSVRSQNVFITGCTSARIHSVKIHEGSANHVKAGKVVYAKRNPKQTVAYKIVYTLVMFQN